MDDCRPEWFDEAWWTREIGAAISTADPVLGNLKITLAHYRLGLTLRHVTGVDAGANFHAWATWGSKKAGQTIRREDTSTVRAVVDKVSAGAGLVAAAVGLRSRVPRHRRALFGGGAAVAVGAPLALRVRLGQTARQVLAGNRTVLDDIGTATARFVAAFHDRPRPDPERLADYLGTLRPGATEAGGQDLLRRAFGHYYRARFETDPVAKHESMLLANCCGILHEHIRLQPYIRAAVPWVLRGWVTSRLLGFSLGAEALAVAMDVPTWEGASFPASLLALTDAELVAFLAGPGGWDRTPDSLLGSAAADWTALPDRMNYIVDLFRSRHLVPNLFAPPFTPEQTAAIEAGRVPPGPL